MSEEKFCFARQLRQPGVLMGPIDGSHDDFGPDSLDRARARGAISAFVMTTRTPTRPGVLSSVGVRLSLRVLLLLGILPGGFVI
jgi:hypothetical protein